MVRERRRQGVPRGNDGDHATAHHHEADMGQRGVLRTLEGGHVAFFCPGCECAHVVRITPAPGAWGFNGDYERPTFMPSVLVWRDGNPAAAPGFERYREAQRCHSFVRDGQIEFLTDCNFRRIPPAPSFEGGDGVLLLCRILKIAEYR